MQMFIGFTNKLAAMARRVVEAAIIALMLVTVADVVLRHTVNVSIMGVTEFSQILMAVIMLATGATAMQDGHIKVDIVMNHCPKAVQYICAAITCALSAFISALISIRSFVETGRAFTEHQTYISLGIVKWPFYLIYAAALAILAFAAAALIVKYVHMLMDGRGGKTNE